MSEFVALNDFIRFNIGFFHPTSGFSSNTDATPRWLMYRNDADSPALQGDLVLRTNLTGQYRGSGLISSATFASGDYVHILASGRVGGIQGFQKIKEFVISDIFNARLVDGVTHGGPDTLLQLERIAVTSKTSNQSAVSFTGNGTGAGLNSTGGSSGPGGTFSGGSTGQGLSINGNNAVGLYVGSTNADGIYVNGAFHGVKIVGNAINGLDISATNGIGVNVAAGGAFPGTKITSGTNNDGVVIVGNGTGYGVHISGGVSSSDIYLARGSGNIQNVLWNFNRRTVTSAANITSNSGTIPMSSLGYPQVDVWRVLGATEPANGWYDAGTYYFNNANFPANIVASGLTQGSIHRNAYNQIGSGVWTSPSRFLTNASGITNTGGTITVSGGIVSSNVTQVVNDGIAAIGIYLAGTSYSNNGYFDSNLIRWGGTTPSFGLGANNYPIVDVGSVSGVVNSNIISVLGDTDSATGLYTMGLGYQYNGEINADIDKVNGSSAAAGYLQTLVTNYNNDGYLDSNVERWSYTLVSLSAENKPLVAIDTASTSGIWNYSDRTLNNIYYLNMKYVRDTSDGVLKDKYAVQWYRNGSPVTSGQLTNPSMSVYNTLTGAALITNGVMSYASPVLGQTYYQTNSNIQTSGVPYLVVASGTIDGATRQWNQIVGLDLL